MQRPAPVPAIALPTHPADPLTQTGLRRRGPERTTLVQRLLEGRGFVRLMLAVDALMLVLAVGAAALGARATGIGLERPYELVVFPVLALALMQARGLYRPRLRVLLLDGLGAIAREISLAAMLTIALVLVTGLSDEPAPLVARAWAFGLLYVGGGRALLTLTQRRARRRGALSRPALIVGAGIVGARVARRLESRPEYGLRPIGFLDADPPPAVDVADRRAPVLGAPDDLEEVVAETGATHVILGFTSEPDLALVPLARRCEELGVEVSLVPRLFESVNERVALEHLGGMPLLALRSVDPQGWQFTIKHALDRVAAALMLLAVSPIMIAAALAVKLSSRGPVFHRLEGVGRDGHVFEQYKFRSMRMPDAERDFKPRPGYAPGGVEGEDRRTAVGRFLRKSAIDELPQLFNVLRGDMSMVGPRPERPEFVALFEQDINRYDDRHRVKSGLTGWAQVHGLRGQRTSLDDRVEWDNYYIENWSLWLDFKILLMTLVTFMKSGDPD